MGLHNSPTAQVQTYNRNSANVFYMAHPPSSMSSIDYRYYYLILISEEIVAWRDAVTSLR